MVSTLFTTRSFLIGLANEKKKEMHEYWKKTGLNLHATVTSSLKMHQTQTFKLSVFAMALLERDGRKHFIGEMWIRDADGLEWRR